jgi:hypothetical protein
MVEAMELESRSSSMSSPPYKRILSKAKDGVGRKNNKDWVKSTCRLLWTELLNNFKDGIIYIELHFIQYLAFLPTLKNMEFL